MKSLEKALKVMTWAAWVAFAFGLATLETPNAFSCVCLVFSTAWLITSALLREELAGDEP